VTDPVIARVERVMRHYRQTLALMSTHQTVKLTFKPLILASALAAFSTCGLAEDTDLGKMNYESNCAACHGQSGKGDGPVSAELRTKPTDLTLIAKRNGGVFPADVLYRVIDGRKTIRAHGTYEMPVWGLVFLRSDPEDVARSRILAIIAYLKSLQLEQ
jgi:mono/diheme cytochrome c family protein